MQIELSGGVFLGALGLFFILWGAVNRTAGLFIPGGILSGLSVGVFLIEDMIITSGEMFEGGIVLLSLAGGFALIPVLSWLFTRCLNGWAWIVSGALALLGAGLIILELPNAGILQQVVETIFNASQYFWPLVLIGLGIWIIFQKREA
jgi:hypothetical protein